MRFMDKQKQPTVSIVMPVYNSYDFVRSENRDLLKNAIESLLRQTYRNFELIILDNQSIDNTVAICERYARQDSRIRFIRDDRRRYPEEGIHHAATFATGKYLMIANDDDEWDSRYIEILVDQLESFPDIDLCYADGKFIDVDGRVVGVMHHSFDFVYSQKYSPLSNLARYIINRNPVPISFGIFKREAFFDILPYEAFDNLKADVDNHFIAKLFIKKKRVNFVDRPLFFYRVKKRKLDPSKVSDMPGLERSDLIAWYYLKHQFLLYKKIVGTFQEYNQPTQGQIDYLISVTLYSLFKRCGEILVWLEKESSREGGGYNILKKMSKTYARLVTVNLNAFSHIGNFSSDDSDNVRFHSISNYYLLKIVSVCFENFVIMLNEEGTGDIFVKEFIDSIRLEFVSVKKRLEEIRIETIQVPQILTQDFSLQRETGTEILPLISVISTSYNLASFIEETMRSVTNQSFGLFEHIVIDGGSTDDSLRLLEKYPNIILISERDKGYVDAFWKGLRLAKGKYIAQCAVSDAYATRDWLAKCARALEDNRDISLVWGFPQYLTEESIMGDISYPQFHYSEAPQKEDMFRYWLTTFFFYPEGNMCVHKAVMMKCYPTLEESKGNIIDWLEFAYRFNRMGYLSYHIPVVANFGRTHQNQMGQLLNLKGTLRSKNEDYQRKVWGYRVKLLLNVTKHKFIDADGASVDTRFYMKDYICEVVAEYILTIRKKYSSIKKKSISWMRQITHHP